MKISVLVLLLSAVFLLGVVDSYSQNGSCDYEYVFRTGDSPWQVIKSNYGFVNGKVVEDFLKENNIKDPRRIKVGTVVLLHKNLVNIEKVRTNVEKKIEKKYLKEIERLDSNVEVAKIKNEELAEAINLKDGQIDDLEKEAKNLSSLLSLTIAIGVLLLLAAIGKIISLNKKLKQRAGELVLKNNEIHYLKERATNLRDGYSVLGRAKNLLDYRLKKVQEEKTTGKNKLTSLIKDQEMIIHGLREGIGRLQEERTRLVKGFDVLDIWKRKKPGNLDMIEVDEKYYPRIVVAWELSGVIETNRKSLREIDLCSSEIKMACGGCRAVVGNYQSLVSHWENKDFHSNEERERTVKDIFSKKPERVGKSNFYYMSDYIHPSFFVSENSGIGFLAIN